MNIVFEFKPKYVTKGPIQKMIFKYNIMNNVVFKSHYIKTAF